MSEQTAKPKYEQLGLSKSEYERILEILGRAPNDVELAIYSLMWSEHCGYKHSRKVLKNFPTTGPRVLQGPGENAGVVDIGDGLAIALKIESHNHPSAVEPFQGAATGVGGIVRDIFAMGARPIASLNSLRFGELAEPRQKYLLEGVVAGIASYGNCLGIPTVGGEVYFEPSYAGNCLVNAMSVGLLRHDQLITAEAAGEGNLVVLLGSKTGRDGIGGASVLASQEFDEHLQAKRPSVQVGDPFMEKLLIECCLQLLADGLLVALGDLGAAGITSSASEMASRGNVGIDLDAGLVPLREADMEPWEIMVSESQERMLLVVEPGKLGDVMAVCSHWEVPATVVGKITAGDRMRVLDSGKVVGDMPVKTLTDDAPAYTVASRRPGYLTETADFDASDFAVFPNHNMTLLDLISSPNICSRGWVWRQYDHQVQTNTVVLPGSDAAVLRLRGTKKGIALTTDGNGRYTYLDPYVGGKLAVYEAARNLAVSGAEPVAVTDCLNFGNPEKPEIFWQFEQAVAGISDACRELGVPVVSGNVSFYNESFGQAIYPTPVVGMLGLLEDVEAHCTMPFKQEGDLIAVVGAPGGRVDGSEYLKVVHQTVAGTPAAPDPELEKAGQRFCLRATGAGLLASAHDCAEGGMAVTLAECCVAGNIGAKIDLNPTEDEFEQVEALFGEAPARVVVSFRPDDRGQVERIAFEEGVPYLMIGEVTKLRKLRIDATIDLRVSEMAGLWQSALEDMVRA